MRAVHAWGASIVALAAIPAFADDDVRVAKAPMIDARGAFEIRGPAPGAHRIAFDQAGERVAGEFEIGDEDVTRDFVFSRR